jgi:predicted nucleic acid-binding protein
LIAVDTNILVYAYDEAAPMHERALAAMDRLV